MYALFREFWLICSFKKNPALLPYSMGLFLFTLVASIFANTHLTLILRGFQIQIFEGLKDAQPDKFPPEYQVYLEQLKGLTLWSALTDMLIAVMVASALLWAFFTVIKKNNRFLKVATAIFGCSCVCYSVFLSVFLVGQLSGLSGVLVSSALVVVKLWNGIVEAFILKNALETNWLLAIVVSVMFEYLQLQIMSFIGVL